MKRQLSKKEKVFQLQQEKRKEKVKIESRKKRNLII
jgi:hypothetical protein